MLLIRKLLTFLIVIFFCISGFTQSIGINDDNSSPNSNAILDIKSSDKGLLIPRLTTAERNAFASVLSDTDVGMMIFDSDEAQFYFWRKGVFQRLDLSSRLVDSDLDTEVTVERNEDEDIIRFYTSGLERWRIKEERIEPANENGLVLIGTDAGLNNGSRINNIAIGDSSLYHNGTGVTIGDLGNNNIGIGKRSLQNNVSGSENVGLGTFSLNTNTDASGNTAIGFNTLSGNSEGDGNSALGHQALEANRTGQYNVGIGVNALRNNTVGNSNVAIGTGALFNPFNVSYNVALGWNALSNGTGVNHSIAIGANAAKFNTVSEVVAIGDSSLMYNGLGSTESYHGLGSVAIGNKALKSNTLGYYNTGVGHRALSENISGTDNTAFGSNALRDNTYGVFNTAIGSGSLDASETGNSNTGIGFNALSSNISGNNNSALGTFALNSNQDGDSNIAIGTLSLTNNNGNRNIAIGINSSYNGTTANGNVSIGHASLYRNSVQDGNIAIGDSAMYDYLLSVPRGGQVAIGDRSQRNLTSGYNNVAVGRNTLLNNQTGTSNSAFGTNALLNNTGDSNSAFGDDALEYSTGDDNTGFGNNALRFAVSGDENTAVGSNSLLGNETRHRRTAVGYSANSLGDNGNNTGIGNDADCTAAHQVRLGNSIVTSIGGYANWTNISDGNFKKDIKEDVVGLAFIEKLRPVTYTLNLDAVYDFYEKNYGEDKRKRYEQKSGAGTMIRSGFIAQEVEKTAQRLGYDFSGVDAPKNEKDYYGLRYAAFVVPLVKAVQEQQDIIEIQKAAILQQEEKMADLENRLARLEGMVNKESYRSARVQE